MYDFFRFDSVEGNGMTIVAILAVVVVAVVVWWRKGTPAETFMGEGQCQADILNALSDSQTVWMIWPRGDESVYGTVRVQKGGLVLALPDEGGVMRSEPISWANFADAFYWHTTHDVKSPLGEGRHAAAEEVRKLLLGAKGRNVWLQLNEVVELVDRTDHCYLLCIHPGPQFHHVD